jgi:hypothetical protein
LPVFAIVGLYVIFDCGVVEVVVDSVSSTDEYVAANLDLSNAISVRYCASNIAVPLLLCCKLYVVVVAGATSATAK